MHVVPPIGDNPMNEITTEDVQKVKSALTDGSPVLAVRSCSLVRVLDAPARQRQDVRCRPGHCGIRRFPSGSRVSDSTFA